LQKIQTGGNNVSRIPLTNRIPLVDSLFMPTSMPDMIDARNWFTEVAESRRRRFLASRREDVWIHIDDQRLVNFACNDYLGLSHHEAVCMAAQGACADGVGSGASRLVSGDHPMIHRLEEKLATWKGYEACLIVGSGMLANLGLLQALADRHTHIFSDRLNHASLVDGARLSGAHRHRFKHLDTSQLEQLLEKHPAERRIIVSDGIFSMDGDAADAAALLELAEKHDTLLIIDDAHGIGCMGPDGKGITGVCDIAKQSRLIEVGTFGKAFGAYGAFMLGNHEMIEGLRQRQRSMIYSTALPIALIAAAETSLALIQRGEERQQLQQHLSLFKQRTAALGFMDSDSPIQPLVIGSDEQALQMAAKLREAGFFVPAIRPPTVPEGTARLRITITACHTEQQIEQLTECLKRLLGNQT